MNSLHQVMEWAKQAASAVQAVVTMVRRERLHVHVVPGCMNVVLAPAGMAELLAVVLLLFYDFFETFFLLLQLFFISLNSIDLPPQLADLAGLAPLLSLHDIQLLLKAVEPVLHAAVLEAHEEQDHQQNHTDEDGRLRQGVAE